MRGWTIFPSLTNVAYTLARQHCSFLNFAPPRPLSPLHHLPITTHTPNHENLRCNRQPCAKDHSPSSPHFGRTRRHVSKPSRRKRQRRALPVLFLHCILVCILVIILGFWRDDKIRTLQSWKSLAGVPHLLGCWIRPRIPWLKSIEYVGHWRNGNDSHMIASTPLLWTISQCAMRLKHVVLYHSSMVEGAVTLSAKPV